MSDRNTHGEPICDWSDLPTAMCAHCTGAKLDVLADQTPTDRRPARPGVVVRARQCRSSASTHAHQPTSTPSTPSDPTNADSSEDAS